MSTDNSTPDLEALAKLREPFPPEAISKLPKGNEDKSKRQTCRVCKGYHDPSMFHLDYVGHAALTDRLLSVDPTWTWEPFALDEHGAPLMERDNGRPVGLWIRLTVAGMTRPGYGSCPPGKNEAVKELIGDALRNAAMRFGCALDLWHKGDLPESEDAATAKPSQSTAKPSQSKPKPAPVAKAETAAKPLIVDRLNAAGVAWRTFSKWVESDYDKRFDDLDDEERMAVVKAVTEGNLLDQLKDAA
jgi:hypothetical protein